jgi:hypothetical protein
MAAVAFFHFAIARESWRPEGTGHAAAPAADATIVVMNRHSGFQVFAQTADRASDDTRRIIAMHAA